jgi:hypothetical protein
VCLCVCLRVCSLARAARVCGGLAVSLRAFYVFFSQCNCPKCQARRNRNRASSGKVKQYYVIARTHSQIRTHVPLGTVLGTHCTLTRAHTHTHTLIRTHTRTPTAHPRALIRRNVQGSDCVRKRWRGQESEWQRRSTSLSMTLFASVALRSR